MCEGGASVIVQPIYRQWQHQTRGDNPMAIRTDTQPSLTLVAKPRRLSSLMSDFAYLGRMLSHGLAGLAEQRVPGASTNPARHYGEDFSARMARACEPQQVEGR